MSASVGQVQRPRDQNTAAAKARRQKIIAIGGICVLAIVLAIQLPKTLKLLKGSGSSNSAATAVTPAPTPAPATAPVPTPATPAQKSAPGELQALLRAHGVDPFLSRGLVSSDRRPAAVGAPAGTHDPFLRNPFVSLGGESPARAVSSPAGLRDPFVKTSVGAAASGPIRVIVVGTRGHGKPKIGYIVVLASIPLTEGRNAALRFAAQARRNGIGGVSVLNSSSRKPLRHGYWVVFIGSYKTVSAATTAASHVHTLIGYGGSYVRQLVRYG